MALQFSLRLCNRCLRELLKVPFPRRDIASASRYVLGIETSCDDTGAAIVDEQGNLISESLYTQLPIHIRNGGIIPPIARDLHREKIDSVVTECIQKSGLRPSDLEAVAVTTHPGLALSLLVGTVYAKKIAKEWKKPLIPIHHMEAHALTIRMVEDVQFPFLVLLISGYPDEDTGIIHDKFDGMPGQHHLRMFRRLFPGGHCLLALAEDIDKYKVYGTCLDDAPGEALDKTARELHLSHLPQYEKMSGGAAIEHLAKLGDRSYFPFPLIMSRHRDCDFSFGGIKWKAKKYIKQEEEKYDLGPNAVIPTAAHLCASFLHCIARSLAKRLERVMVYCDSNNLFPPQNKKVVVSGGVACSQYIKEILEFICQRNGYTLHVPPPKLCCDNGAMIAWNGVEKLKKNVGVTWDFDSVDIDASATFGTDVRKEIVEANIKVNYLKFPESSLVVKKPDGIAMAASV